MLQFKNKRKYIEMFGLFASKVIVCDNEFYLGTIVLLVNNYVNLVRNLEFCKVCNTHTHTHVCVCVV